MTDSRRIRTRWLLLTACACGSLVLTSCGGDKPEANTSEAPITASTLPVEQAAAMAEQGLLRLEDLPAGFAPDVDEDDDDASEAPPPECAYMERWDGTMAGRGASATYAYNAPGPSISHYVAYLDPQTTQQILDSYASEPTARCFQLAYDSLVGYEATNGNTVEAVSVLPMALDQRGDTLRYTMSANVRSAADGTIVPLKGDIVLERNGPWLSTLVTTGSGGLPLPIAEIEAKVDARIGAAV